MNQFSIFLLHWMESTTTLWVSAFLECKNLDDEDWRQNGKCKTLVSWIVDHALCCDMLLYTVLFTAFHRMLTNNMHITWKSHKFLLRVNFCTLTLCLSFLFLPCRFRCVREEDHDCRSNSNPMKSKTHQSGPKYTVNKNKLSFSENI